MDVSLEDYISHKPTLQAAIVGAQMRSKYDRRVYNSEEFKAESRQYVCTEMELDSDDSVKKTNSMKDPTSILNGPTFEEAYLTLDLNDEDEFDEMYDQLNSNLTAQPKADKKSNIAQQETPSTDSASVTLSSDEKINYLLKQSGFDLRQVVEERQQLDSQQWRLKAPNVSVQRPAGLPSLIPKNCITNTQKNNNRQKQATKGANNNRTSRKNTPYQNGRFRNGNCRKDDSVIYSNSNSSSLCSNGSQCWSNSSLCTPVAKSNSCGFGLNGGFNHHGISLPLNVCQSCDCNGSAFRENGVNWDMSRVGLNRTSLIPPGCNTIGYNGAGILNSSLGCTDFDIRLNNGLNTNILQKLLNNSSGCVSSAKAPTCQRKNDFNILAENLFEQSNCHEFSKNSQNLNMSTGLDWSNGEQMNSTTINIEDLNSDNTSKKSPVQGKNIASALGINPKDLETDSVPVMLAMMQQILQNGITIKLFPCKDDQFKVLNTQKTSENIQM